VAAQYTLPRFHTTPPWHAVLDPTTLTAGDWASFAPKQAHGEFDWDVGKFPVEHAPRADGPLLELPSPGDPDLPAHVGIRGAAGTVTNVAARVWSLAVADEPLALPIAHSTRWFAHTNRPREEPARYRIAPSQAADDWPELEVGHVGQAHVMGSRLPLGRESPKDWSVVGDALHAFLAADLPGLSAIQRLECARRLLAASTLLSLLDPAALLRSGDQLRAWVDSRWPGATWHRELPISGVLAAAQGQRRIDGTIDLLLEVEGGVVLIDHKSYPGQRSTWCYKAREYAPQLAAYAEVLRMAGRRVLSQWISFAVIGGVVEIMERRGVPRGMAAGRWGSLT